MIELLDSQLRRELTLQRLATFMIREYIKPTGQELAAEIPKVLAGYEDLPPVEQKKVFTRILRLTRERWTEAWAKVGGDLKEMQLDELDYMVKMYNEVYQMQFKTGRRSRIATPEMVLTSGTTTRAGVWSEFVNGNTDQLTAKVNGLLKRSAREAPNLQDVLYNLRGRYNRRTGEYEGGIISGQVRSAEALARTGVSHYSNAARDHFAQANRDVLRERIFFATLDNRTTDICLGHHLKTWAITDDSYPRFPLHWGERSVYIFQVASDDPRFNALNGVKRPAKYNGGEATRRIEATTTADAWMKDQERQWVEYQLGKGKAALFLDGGLPLSRFLDAAGRPLTLEELRASHSRDIVKAFSRAGI